VEISQKAIKDELGRLGIDCNTQLNIVSIGLQPIEHQHEIFDRPCLRCRLDEN
jgi:hypothetical protein